MALPTPYPFDPTGVALSNKISGEQHVLTPMNFQDYHFIVPKFGPFFATGLVISHKSLSNVVTPLTEGIDYYLSHWFIGASRACGKPIYGSISFLDLQLSGTVTLSYQSLGGEWTLDEQAIAVILSDRLRNPRTTSWDMVSGAPTVFPPVDHAWNLVDLVGLKEVQAKLAGIEEAILANSDPTTIAGHLQATNPHNITAAMLGVYNKQEVDNLVAANSETGAVAAHSQAIDPHTQYLLKEEADALYAPAGSGSSGLPDVPTEDELFFMAHS